MPARKHRVCVVTGSRSDYGLLYWVMREIGGCDDLELQTVVSGMHLSPEFGLSVAAVEADGFRIDARVEMLLSSDTGQGIGKSIGLGAIGFADAYARLQPDLVMVLGDRFETLAAVVAALAARIPVVHIAGGDLTEGSFDDSIRHAITKLSHLHLVTNEAAAQRVRQLGEQAASVHVVGSPGIDYLRKSVLLNRQALERDLGFRFLDRNLLVTFHPPTAAPGEAAAQFAEVLAALDGLGSGCGVLITYPNADNESRELIAMLDRFVAGHGNAKAYPSLGQQRYLSAMAAVDVLVGNSSSALYEAPTLRKPAVNIGDRQTGRLKAASVVDVAPARGAIREAIERAFLLDCSSVVNPYGDGRSAERIVAVLRALGDPKVLLQKRFADSGPAC